MRRFWLQRNHDETGISGTGRVAGGVLLPSGRVVMEWLATAAGPGVLSIGLYESIDALQKVHGHGGRTVLEWEDVG